MTRKSKSRYSDFPNVETLSNAELFMHYTYFCGGDEQDGCMSDEGNILFELVIDKLVSRLQKIDFLPVNYNPLELK